MHQNNFTRKSANNSSPPVAPLPLPPHSRTDRAIKGHKQTKPEAEKEEIFRCKDQGCQNIKQGSDGNWTKMGRSTLTDIDYNTVAPLY